MKFNFKKISAVTASILMTGMTAGIAAAASYPAPFVDNGIADVAIVYGTGAGVSSLDMVQAGNIQTSLGSSVEGTSTVTGGEVFTLDKSSNHFNIGENMNSTYATLDEDEMELTLAEGDYDDGDVDTEYSQKITLKPETLTLIKDNDYNDNEPFLGFDFAKDDQILEYEMDFDDVQQFSDLVGTDMPLMGKEYYVLSTEVTGTTDKITLLDSASTTVISSGETKVVDGKTVSVTIGDGWAKFTVDGETVDKMVDGDSEELSDGSWIATKEVLFIGSDTTNSVEFTIGAGKLVLEDGQEVEINEEDVDGLTVTLTNNSGLDKITLAWAAAEDSWLMEDEVLTMPGFEALQVLFGEITFPEAEKISFDSGDELVINMENYDIPVLWTNATGDYINGLGEENHPLIVNTSTSSVLLQEDDRFVVTILPTSNDLSDAETRYYEVQQIENDSGTIEVIFDDLIGTSDVTLDDADATDEGDFIFDITGTVFDDANMTISFTSSIGTVYMNKIVTEKGLVIGLPSLGSGAGETINVTAGFENTTYDFILTEADEDENINLGMSFNLTVALDATEDELYITNANTSELELNSNEDEYVSYVTSALATKIIEDRSTDPDSLSIEYYGEEVTADVSIGSAEASISASGGLGDVLVKDSEVSSVTSKNLVIVGGSCINSAAATALGVAEHTCGAAFTEATGVASGEFLIKGVQDAFTAGKLALVVAGYESADTVNAATYLTMKDVDTSKEYKGTTSTEATLVTA